MNLLPNFIIGGTEKAGTTSIFTYLSAHPEVAGSVVKETNFLRDYYTGKLDVDRAQYSKYFDAQAGSRKILMEASPGYLAEGDVVAARVSEMVPDAKILFVLRDPVDRLYSSYQFHLGKLNIPSTITFEEYFDSCARFDSFGMSKDCNGIGEWYLRVASHGLYSKYIGSFFDKLPAEQIKVAFFEDFNADVYSFMIDLCGFLEVDPQFFDGYEFKKINATFSGRVKWLHKIAVLINEKAEVVLRQRPSLKSLIVRLYKAINQEREGYDAMSASVRRRVVEYYAESVADLSKYVPGRKVPWPDFDH